MINSRTKGASGEREVVNLIEKYTGVRLERNLAQSRDGGCDILWERFRIEIKRCKNIPTDAVIDRWWAQAEGQADGDEVPILVYRADRQRWKIVDKREGVLATYDFEKVLEKGWRPHKFGRLRFARVD